MDLDHLVNYFSCCYGFSCYATKEHKVKDHGRDTTWGINAQFFKKLPTPIYNCLYETLCKFVLNDMNNGLAVCWG